MEISTGVALLLDQRARTCKTPWQWKASQLPGTEHHHDIAAPQATDARYLSTLQCLENLETWFSRYYIKNTPQKHGHWMPLNDHTIHSSHSIHSHVAFAVTHDMHPQAAQAALHLQRLKEAPQPRGLQKVLLRKLPTCGSILDTWYLQLARLASSTCSVKFLGVKKPSRRTPFHIGHERKAPQGQNRWHPVICSPLLQAICRRMELPTASCERYRSHPAAGNGLHRCVENWVGTCKSAGLWSIFSHLFPINMAILRDSPVAPPFSHKPS